MILLLITISSLSTIALSYHIISNIKNFCMLDIAKLGYKIDTKILDNYLSKKKHSLYTKILSLIPIINLIYAKILLNNIIDDILNNKKITKYLLPMSEEEITTYLHKRSIEDKLTFITFTNHKDNIELNTYNKTNIISYDTLYLKHNSLPNKYFLEEVKTLNDITGYSYKLGIVNNEYYALIGIPNPNIKINKININNITYPFKCLEDKDNLYNKYIVYPYKTNSIIDKNLEQYYSKKDKKVIKDILQRNFKLYTKDTVKLYNHKFIEVYDNKENSKGKVLTFKKNK